MEGKVIEVKIARAELAEVEAVIRFLTRIEGVLAYQEYVDEESNDIPVPDEDFHDFVRAEFKKIAPNWKRVLWNADTLLRNVVDPNSKTLELHPLLAKLQTLAEPCKCEWRVLRCGVCDRLRLTPDELDSLGS